MSKPRIIIATPHKRNDQLVGYLQETLSDYEVSRITAKEELAEENLNKLAPEYIFFPHWSWIIPDSIHKKYNCIIFHMTDLPYGRGGSPLQNLIVRNHKSTKLSAIVCTTELDGGDVYMKESLELSGSAEEILQRASNLMKSMIQQIVSNGMQPTPQTGDVVTFERRKPEDSNMASLDSLERVYDWIRMLDADGYPPAFLDVGPFRLEFKNAHKTETGEVMSEVLVREKSND